MAIDAGGGSARRRHRFPSSHSVLLVSMYLVLLSVLIPVDPPPRISHSPSSTCLKSIVSSASRSSSRHSSVLSSATTFQTSATSSMLPPDLAPQGSTAPLIIAVSPTSPSLSTVPPCTSGDTRSTHPEQRLARSGRFCISKAPPPLHTASDPFTDAVTPSCCSVSYLDYTVHQCRSDLVSFIIAANLRRSRRGGVSHSCSIASFSVRSPDPATASVFNLRISPTLVSFLAGFDNDVFASVIEPTLRQRQVLYRDKLFRVDLLSSPPIARFCPLRFNLLPHLGRDIEKGQFAPPLPCALIPTKRRNTPKYCARRLDRSKTLCLLPDVTLNTLNQNECDVNMLRSVSVTNYWLRHGNVEVQGFDPSKLLSSSSNSIVLSVPKKAKLALEIHLVSLRSFVEFRTDPTNFSAKSSQIGLLLGVAQSLGASHQKLLSRNSPTASYWCINVDFDYQLFLRTIALGIKYLVEAYETRVAEQEKKKLTDPVPLDEEAKAKVLRLKRQWGASWWEQYCILFSRGLKERRHEYFSWLRVTQVLSTAVILGLLWWQSDIRTPRGLQDQAGLLFFIAVFWGFFPVFTAIFAFPQERAMLNKERAADMYRLSAYFLARTTSDLPLDFILPSLFLLVVYFMTGLRLSPYPFFLSMLTVFLCIIASQGLGLAIGAILMDLKKATTLASVTVMTFMLAGGFFVKKVPVFISWIRYLSFNYHTYKLLLKVQYKDFAQSINGMRIDNGMTEVVALVVMIFGYRLLAYLSLRQMKITT